MGEMVVRAKDATGLARGPGGQVGFETLKRLHQVARAAEVVSLDCDSLERAAVPLHQGDPQTCFEVRQATAHRGLRDAHLLGIVYITT